MRVLLVDDDREVADYVRRELEEESFRVVVAHDGAAALRLVETSPFDIVVLDVMMPFMDGLEVTRNMRRQNIQTPILLAKNYMFHHGRFDGGCSAFVLRKPS